VGFKFYVVVNKTVDIFPDKLYEIIRKEVTPHVVKIVKK